ncbi:hypothetical protein [Psychromonas aquimarina]|uniref:hypothetical protein n=1 Tax=Psychromonas aquimarina TaxID=444919 RepID=UPI0003FDA90C|nr:hypothetical protein [Psychromonas aquimarina]
MKLENTDDSVVTWRKTCEMCGGKFLASMSKPFPIRVRDFKTAFGLCRECTQMRRHRYKMKKRREKNLFFARDLHWTFDSVKKYFETNPPYKGQELIVLDSSFNKNTYVLVTVGSPAHSRQKIIIDGYSNGYSGKSFHFSGKNCFSPEGLVRLFPYHHQIGSLIKQGDGKSICLDLEQIITLIGEKNAAEQDF